MGRYKDYKIELRGLEQGLTTFDYVLDDTFFKLINDEDSDVRKGNVNVVLNIERVGNVFNMTFNLNGSVIIPCDRCLDDIIMPIETTNKLIVKFGDKYSEESEEIVVVPESEGIINVSWFLYEFIVLSLPMKHVHPSGQCNKTVMSKLKKHKAYLKDDIDDSDDDLDSDSEDYEQEEDN